MKINNLRQAIKTQEKVINILHNFDGLQGVGIVKHSEKNFSLEVHLVADNLPDDLIIQLSCYPIKYEIVGEILAT
jgi:hypothetical protein